MLTNVGTILKNHSIFFRAHYNDYYGLALFVKKDLKVIEEGDIFVFKQKENIFDDFNVNHARNLQHITIETSNGLRTILNFHGLFNGRGKGDSPERLAQSDNIVKFLKNISHHYILMGGFNLEPGTKSLKKLEELGLRNLISEFGVTSTRSSYYKKPIRFADYTFVTKDIKVNYFKILPDKISDHLAMYLDFE